MVPVWRDPAFCPAYRVRQFELHEQEIRDRERARERRRFQALLPVDDSERWSDDFEGCVE